jgi:hypothetical protein
MVEGFEEYVSGFPVVGEEWYALAKTWYAPEMERPGCVWTHVLLVRNEDLSRIVDARTLLKLFTHPGGANPEKYQVPLMISEEQPTRASSAIAFEEVLRLVAALYERPEKPVVIPAPTARAFEDLVLGAWSQQWLALRSIFRFCTGSLSSRVVEGRPFDLQVVPHRLARELQRDSEGFTFVSAENDARPVEAPAWMRAGAMDLVEPQSERFRDFLWRYAEPCAEGRGLYRELGELFIAISGLRDSSFIPSELTRQVCSTFPSPECGTALKNDLYGANPNAPWLMPSVPEWDRLRELATTSLWSAFDAKGLNLRSRASALWRSQPTKAEDLLLELFPNTIQPLCDELVAGFAEAVSAQEACRLADRRTGLLLGLVARNPQLVTSEVFWRCQLPLQTYYDILDLLQVERPERLRVALWIPALIKSGSEELAGPVVDRFGAEAVKAFLGWFETDMSVVPGKVSPAWRAALATQRDELLSSAVLGGHLRSNRTMVLLAGILDPHLPEVTAIGLDPWLALVREEPNLVLEFPNADASAFLLSLGLQQGDQQAVELLVTCFEHVHAAAGDESLSYRGWHILIKEVPALSWTRNWDKCERLRRAVLLAFVRNRWSFDDFLRCVRHPETLHRMLYSCREISGGEVLMVSLAEKVLSGAARATEEQQALFQRFFHRNRRGKLRLSL